MSPFSSKLYCLTFFCILYPYRKTCIIWTQKYIITSSYYFFRYNSGGKKFTQIHTKHLTVTIDAFTIHNALWLGKKAKLPDKRDMALVV